MVHKNGKRTSLGPRILLGRRPTHVAYQTQFGRMYRGDTESLDMQGAFNRFAGQVQLIFTSPPFPLNRKKKYGNLAGEEYIEWLARFGTLFKRLLKPDGSIVIELGNSWQSGSPTMSTLALRSLLRFKKRNRLKLCQEFVWYNPAKLPTPAQWVTVERIRVKDNFTKLWWLATTSRPKADNRGVLTKYSSSMQSLLTNGHYNSGARPSQHRIGESSFLKNNGGAIPGNVITAANTISQDDYQVYCKRKHLTLHPARMPIALASFFINFLTDEGDIVFDPFAGSNTTGAAAEILGRHWIAVESVSTYIKGSRGRFAGALCE
jgi:DNA modification methylase